MVSSLNHRLYRFKKQITQIFLLVAGFWLLVSLSYAQSNKYVRVNIFQDTNFLRLKINGLYEIIDSTNQKVLYRGRNFNSTVTVYKDNILIGNISSRSNKVMIKSEITEDNIINDRKFRGDIELVRRDNSHFSLINYIELEDYIKGILYHESSHYWPQEALKAQAIVCRTYAVCQMQENASKDYDVTSDIYSQVYGGKTSERYRTNKAIQQTKGLILTYQGKVFPTYYHATCSGQTEDASLLWNIDIVPLKGVVCNFCKESPHFKWHYVLSRKQIEDKLVKADYKIKDIKDIIILGRNKSGRVTDLKIVSSKEEIKISAKDFRNIIGPNIIRSTKFSVNLVDDDAVFVGFGWGHGVGLCQWGAYFMAKLGYNYKQILNYYYPEANVEIIRF